MSAPVDATPFLIEQIRIAADDLRTAWTWLQLLVEPGHATAGPGRAVDDQQAERLEAVGRSDRAYRAWNLARGMSALPPSPAAARISVIDGQVLVHDLVASAVRMLAGTGGDARTWTRADVALQQVPTALDWLVGCPVALGVDGRDGVWLRRGAVDRIRDSQLAADVDKLLQRANRTARAAAGDTDEILRPLAHRCPACGRRSLQLDHESSDRTRWSVRCVSERCVCTGDGGPDQAPCGCSRRSRQAGRRHVWPYGELDGPHGLLTVVDRIAHTRPGVGRGAVGHGGWASRGIAGTR